MTHSSQDNCVLRFEHPQIARRRLAYERNRHTELLSYASALYSARYRTYCRLQLLRLREALEKCARELLAEAPVATFSANHSVAEAADILSTILLWISCRVTGGGAYRVLAGRVCERGLRMSADDPQDHHMWYSLQLTNAQLCIRLGDPITAERILKSLAPRVSGIADANQRARVYRKLGMLMRKYATRTSVYARGVFWSVRACFVPRAALGVRSKSVYALFVS